MANLKSSKKDIRRIERRSEARKPFARNAYMFTKKVLKLVSAGNAKEAAEMLPQAFKAIDKAAKKNIIHANKAARMKSRISRAVNAILAKG